MPASCILPCILDAWLGGKCGADAANLAAALREEQIARLRAQLDFARTHSRFYRERLKSVPAHFFREDLSCLPFTTAGDLRDWKSFLCVSQDSVERVVTIQSSGTSGPPKRLAFSRADLAATRDFFQAGMEQLVQRGDRALVLWPGARRPNGVSALLREALGEKGVTAFAGEPLANPGSLRREIAEYNPHAIIAAPRQLAPLAALLSGERPAAIRRLALRGILSSAEILPPDLAHALRKRYALQVLDHYGMTESGYGGGVECPAHDGYHLRELDLVVEIVDIESGRPLPDGEEGEIVMTTLTREAMPLIRYRTGDAASMLPGPCRCGSPLRRLSPVKGRIVRKDAAYSIEKLAKGSFHERTAHASL
jgi:phenylacetate-coenzyme A ligase PaaK-like adenylate-forming protein